MSRPLNVLLPTLFALLLLPFGAARAQGFNARDLMRAQRNGQSANLYGSNPYDQTEEEGEGEGSDTTRRERRIRKPLESYFFGDSLRALPNFRYNVSERFNRVQIVPMDTTLTDFRIDYPFYREDVGDIAQGALGQTSLPINYFRRSTERDFAFAQPYDAYTFRLGNIPFYNVKRPVTRLTYIESGQKRFREENFGILHAQNISPSTGFNLDYKARGTRGLYEWSRTKNHTLSVAVNHTGRRYSVHAGYYNNHIEQQENGGVVGEWAIADTVFQMPSGVPMKLADAEAQNTYRNNAFYVVQSYGIPLQRLTDRDFSMADLSAVYVGHAFEYSAWSKTYSDLRAPYTNERDHRDENGDFVAATDEYYKDWYINPQRSRDSLYERRISNRFFVQAQPWDRNGVIGTIDAGVGIDLHTYAQFDAEDYLTGRYGKTRETDYYVYGAVSGKIKRFADWDANVSFHPTGDRSGDLSVGGHVALTTRLRGHAVILDGRFSLERRSPSYWQEHLYTNHYIWDNAFSRETETRFEGTLAIPDYGLEAGLRQSFLSNPIYYGADARVVQGDEVKVTAAYLRKDFRLGGFHLDHRILLQRSSNEAIAPVPHVAAYLSYYYEFWVVRNVLRLQAGIDGRYNTKYHAPSYDPALSAYYNQREIEVGGYPYLDAFLMAKWKRMRIFVKVQHLNQDLIGTGAYFSAANYPLNPRMFKLGISWGFYD